MALPQHHRNHHEVIDLLSDTDNGNGEATAADRGAPNDPTSSPLHNASPSAAREWPAELGNNQKQSRGQYCEIDGEMVFIPSEDSSPTVEPSTAARFAQPPAPEVVGEVANAEDCLKRVLELYPDISHDHVNAMYNAFDTADDYESLPASARFDNIIEQLISSNSYPKQSKSHEKGKKRKRDDDAEDAEFLQWLRPEREYPPGAAKRYAFAMLTKDFPRLPHPEVWKVLEKERYLFQAYLALAKTNVSEVPFANSADPAIAHAMGVATRFPALYDELQAARRRVEKLRSADFIQEALQLREKENLRMAIEGGETAECQACFDTYPMNRQIHCSGPTAHFTCFDCAHTYIKTKVGEAACGLVCTAGCGASYPPHQLNLLADKELLAKLDELEQQKAIRDAGLEDLEECCFCEYKAIMPPIEENFLFACENPDCGKISCRRCRREEHVPISCEEFAKDHKLSSRHKIEEAMTAAMVRECNKCKKKFIKDYGCNKMTCPSCGNLQCYICSKDVKDYSHFDKGDGEPSTSACKLHEDVEERHRREIEAAETATRAEVMKDNPDISEKDLEIKMSAAVRDDLKKTRRRAMQVDGDRLLEIGRARAELDRLRQRYNINFGNGIPLGVPGNAVDALDAMVAEHNARIAQFHARPAVRPANPLNPAIAPVPRPHQARIVGQPVQPVRDLLERHMPGDHAPRRPRRVGPADPEAAYALPPPRFPQLLPAPGQARDRNPRQFVLPNPEHLQHLYGPPPQALNFGFGNPPADQGRPQNHGQQ